MLVQHITNQALHSASLEPGVPPEQEAMALAAAGVMCTIAFAVKGLRHRGIEATTLSGIETATLSGMVRLEGLGLCRPSVRR